MDTLPCIAAIVIAAVQIFCNNGDRERLEKDHPELSRDYAPSNVLMIILLIGEAVYLIKSFIH